MTVPLLPLVEPIASSHWSSLLPVLDQLHRKGGNLGTLGGIRCMPTARHKLTRTEQGRALHCSAVHFYPMQCECSEVKYSAA